MQKVFTFAEISKAAACMDEKVFNYINDCQSESFEGHDAFDLLAFEYAAKEPIA